MRKLAAMTLVLMLGAAGCGDDGESGTTATGSGTGTGTGEQAPAGTEAPVTLSGTVNNEGTADATGMDELEVEADDFSFRPTFIKVTSGQRLTLEVHNEGQAPHTFTSTALGVDQQVVPGERASVEITVPDGDAVSFVCKFHQAGGMQGALYTKAGASVGGPSSSPTTSASTDGSRGY